MGVALMAVAFMGMALMGLAMAGVALMCRVLQGMDLLSLATAKYRYLHERKRKHTHYTTSQRGALLRPSRPPAPSPTLTDQFTLFQPFARNLFFYELTLLSTSPKNDFNLNPTHLGMQYALSNNMIHNNGKEN